MSRLRDANLRQLEDGVFAVLVVGGGINGAVSAASLSARGVRVALIDRGDFAGETSQESSNLAWGGIKYMETLEFPLVRKLCVSRNHLIRTYPSTVKEIRFFAVHPKGFRHRLWKLLLGTLLYWLIGGFFTRGPRLLSRTRMEEEEPIIALEEANGGRKNTGVLPVTSLTISCTLPICSFILSAFSLPSSIWSHEWLPITWFRSSISLSSSGCALTR